MMWQEKWEAGDPAEVLDKRRDIAGRTKQGRAQRALKGLQELFGEGDVARKLEIPEQITMNRPGNQGGSLVKVQRSSAQR